MTLKNIVLIGANGHLGPSVLRALVEEPNFKVSVLTRTSSKSTYPDNVNVIKTDDDLPSDQLKAVLRSQDALVITFAGTQKDVSIKLIDAAFEAGIKHIIPADFGSCDSSDERSLDLVPLYVSKKTVRDHLISVQNKSRGGAESLTWTSLITGHFFDYGLKSGLLSIDLEKKVARVFDEGHKPFAATTLADIGLATVQVLKDYTNPRIKNRLVYVRSLETSQNALIRAVEEVKGVELKREEWSSDAYIAKYKKSLEADMGNHGFTEELVSVEGIVNTDWSTKGDLFVNDILDMPKRDLKALVAEALT